ncbi:hypothetical protein [Klebsiella pneumoniae]|uniref:hypothetical protein n=1 Tax=Klebsiella pneumoniae TaxID=573 RepID=UPI0032C12CD0
MNHTLSDSQLEEMIKSAVNSSAPLPPDEKFSQLISALRELQERRKAAMDSEPVIADCDPEVYEKGASACLVAIPKETAEVICKGISAVTGCKIDWHYIGGRVNIKALRLSPQPAPVVDSEPVAWRWRSGPDRRWHLASSGDLAGEVEPLYRHAQPAPVVPDGYVMVPMRLTAENGAKGALSGEFSETKFVNCPECFGDDECETCDGSGRIEITVPVTWTTIKEIWAKGVEHFAAAPQEVK